MRHDKIPPGLRMVELFTEIEKARGGINKRVVKKFVFENQVLGKEVNVHLGF